MMLSGYCPRYPDTHYKLFIYSLEKDQWEVHVALYSKSMSRTRFEQCGFFNIPQEQISVSAVRWDLRFFILIREDWEV